MVTDLMAVAETLLTEARADRHGRASDTVVHGDRQRVTVLALLAGQSLGEHNSPPAATVHLLRGRATLHGASGSIDLEAGQLAAVPPERHDLSASDDTVLLLTVSLDPA
jgi:quercetin dioxygenase-like cupin family protein